MSEHNENEKVEWQIVYKDEHGKNSLWKTNSLKEMNERVELLKENNQIPKCFEVTSTAQTETVKVIMKQTDTTPTRCTARIDQRVCGGVMMRGEAIPTAVWCSDEGTCSEAKWDECAPRVGVLKCKECGHSVKWPKPVKENHEKNQGK